MLKNSVLISRAAAASFTFWNPNILPFLCSTLQRHTPLHIYPALFWVTATSSRPPAPFHRLRFAGYFITTFIYGFVDSWNLVKHPSFYILLIVSINWKWTRQNLISGVLLYGSVLASVKTSGFLLNSSSFFAMFIAQLCSPTMYEWSLQALLGIAWIDFTFICWVVVIDCLFFDLGYGLFIIAFLVDCTKLFYLQKYQFYPDVYSMIWISYTIVHASIKKLSCSLRLNWIPELTNWPTLLWLSFVKI